MADDLRKSGISIVGDVPWGTHFCCFYETKQDLLDILVPYFKSGLESNEFCLWIISNSELINREEASDGLEQAVPDLARYLAEGRIEIVSHDDWFLQGGTFDFQSVANRFKEKCDEALARGYVGMRVNGSPAWIRSRNPAELREFEKEVDGLFPNQRIIASCTYPVSEIAADFLFDVAHSHQFTIARRNGSWDVLETPQLIRAKREIEKLNEELEQRVTERTRELSAANEELKREIIDRKRAEENLRRAEEQARKVLDTIPALIGTGPPDGTLDYCNQQWLAYTGLTLDQLGAYEELLHPDDKERVFKTWQETVAIGKTYELEQRHRRFDGVYRWFLTRGVPLRDAEGRIERWYGTLTDIDDRKQAEKALQESEAKLKNAQRLATFGYWERDLLADSIMPSEETSRIFGLPPGQVFSEAELQTMIYPEDRQVRKQAFEEALKGSRHYEIEHRIVRSDGEVRFVHVWEEIAYDDSGRPIRMFGTVQDITERKRTEEALRESQHLLELVLTTLPVGVAVTDRVGDIILFNAASKRIWGEIIVPGRQRWLRSKAFWHDSGEPVDPTAWGSVRALSDGQTSSNELLDIEAFDGRQKIIEHSAAPIRNGDGQIVGAVFVNQDVTERVRAEEQLRRTSEQLRALSASVQMAKEEEATRISREIHDELGSTLTSLKWDLEEFGEFLQAPWDSAQFDDARKKIEAMVTLADTTLNTVRRLASELRPVALELGLVEAIEWQALQFQERTGIDVQFECAVERVNLNPEQLTAVFRILQEALTNILRHAQATKVVIAVREQPEEFILTINDNGKGLTESKKLDTQSLGILGMRERAHLIGGDIHIESAALHGTTVTLHVPHFDLKDG